MKRLPIWSTTVESYRLVLGQPLTFLRLAFPVLLVLVAFQGLAMWLLADIWDALFVEMERVAAGGTLSQAETEALVMRLQGPGTIMILVQVLGQAVFLLLSALVLTAWLRLVILGDRGNGRWLLPRVGATEIEMVAGLVIFGLVASIAAVLALVPSVAAVAAIGNGGQVVMVILFTALFLAVCRFALYLPQVACGGGLNPMTAWRQGGGNTLRIFGIYGLIGLPWLLVVMVLQAVTLAAILAYTGFLADPDQMLVLMRDMFAPWRAGAGFLLCWLLLVGFWSGVILIGMALHCAALGLCYADLRQDCPESDGRGEPVPR